MRPECETGLLCLLFPGCHSKGQPEVRAVSRMRLSTSLKPSLPQDVHIRCGFSAKVGTL